MEKADLSEVSAKGAFFGEARAGGVRFVGASLRKATFIDADVRTADFTNADLRDTQLMKLRGEAAKLVGARMDYADLSHADLTNADLGGADLFTAVLHHVKDDGASFARANLRAVKRTDVERLEAEAWQPPPRPKEEKRT